jgi:nitrate reductase gamma subunit
MSETLEFAMGPLFRATLLLMVLGLARLVLLRTVAIIRARRRTPPRPLPWGQVAASMVDWLVPVRHVMRTSPFFNAVSILYHVGLIVTPLFLVSHIVLIEASTGIAWPAIGVAVADVMTIGTLVATAILLGFRIFHRPSREMSSWSDYLLLLLLAIPFVSGIMAAHPGGAPFRYESMMLVHVLSAQLVFVLIPFTKLAHFVMFPLDRLASHVFWGFVPGAGEKVAETLRQRREEVQA